MFARRVLRVHLPTLKTSLRHSSTTTSSGAGSKPSSGYGFGTRGGTSGGVVGTSRPRLEPPRPPTPVFFEGLRPFHEFLLDVDLRLGKLPYVTRGMIDPLKEMREAYERASTGRVSESPLSTTTSSSSSSSSSSSLSGVSESEAKTGLSASAMKQEWEDTEWMDQKGITQVLNFRGMKEHHYEIILGRLNQLVEHVSGGGGGVGGGQGPRSKFMDEDTFRFLMKFRVKKPIEKGEPIRDVLDSLGRSFGRGTRLAAKADVWVCPGTGRFLVNGRILVDYFRLVYDREQAIRPIDVLDVYNKYDVWATVKGGGSRGQSQAIRYALARALVVQDASYDRILDKTGCLALDYRVKEAKIVGRHAARRGFQWVKGRSK